MSKKTRVKHIGGMELSVPAFYEGQDCSGTPDHFITREQFESGKSSGDIQPIHRGKAALLKKLRPLIGVERAPINPKSRWVIVGQTKPGEAPGMPHYAYV